MLFLRKIKIGQKMLLAFLIIVIIIALIGSVGIFSLDKVNLNSRNMYSDNLQSVYSLTDIKQQLVRRQNDIVQIVYLRDENKLSALLEDIQKVWMKTVRILKHIILFL